jgi:hypothetical protein
MNSSVKLLAFGVTIMGFVWVYYTIKLIKMIASRDKTLESASGFQLFMAITGYFVGMQWRFELYQEIKEHCSKMRKFMIVYLILFTSLVAYIISLANA